MNYTLRRVTGDDVQLNIILGRHYTLTTKENSPKDFAEAFKKHYGEDEKLLEKSYAIVTSEDSEPHLLVKNQRAYIMTAGGSTFDNLTFKD